jgi:hypothetical protein
MGETTRPIGPNKAYPLPANPRLAKKTIALIPQLQVSLGVKIDVGHELIVSQGDRAARRAAGAALPQLAQLIIRQENLAAKQAINASIAERVKANDLDEERPHADRMVQHIANVSRAPRSQPIAHAFASQVKMHANDLRITLKNAGPSFTRKAWADTLGQTMQRFPGHPHFESADMPAYYNLICDTFGALQNNIDDLGGRLKQEERRARKKGEKPDSLDLKKADHSKIDLAITQARDKTQMSDDVSPQLKQFATQIEAHLGRVQKFLKGKKSPETVSALRYRLVDAVTSFPGQDGLAAQEAQSYYTLIHRTYGHLRGAHAQSTQATTERSAQQRQHDTRKIRETEPLINNFSNEERRDFASQVDAAAGMLNELEKRAVTAAALESAAASAPSLKQVSDVIAQAREIKQKPDLSLNRLGRKLLDPQNGLGIEIERLTGTKLCPLPPKYKADKDRLPVAVQGKNKKDIAQAEKLVREVTKAIRVQEHVALLRKVRLAPNLDTATQKAAASPNDTALLQNLDRLARTVTYADRPPYLTSVKTLRRTWESLSVSDRCKAAEGLIVRLHDAKPEKTLASRAADTEVELATILKTMRDQDEAQRAAEAQQIQHVLTRYRPKAALFSPNERQIMEDTLYKGLAAKGYSPYHTALFLDDAADVALAATVIPENATTLWQEISAPPPVKMKIVPAHRKKSVHVEEIPAAPVIQLLPHIRKLAAKREASETLGIKGPDKRMQGWGIPDTNGFVGQIVSTYYDGRERSWRHDCAIICPTTELAIGYTPLIKPTRDFAHHTAFSKQPMKERKAAHGKYMRYMHDKFDQQPCMAGFTSSEYAPAIICSFMFDPARGFEITRSEITTGQAQVFSQLSQTEGNDRLKADNISAEFALWQQFILQQNIAEVSHHAYSNPHRAITQGSIELVRGMAFDRVREGQIECLFAVSGRDLGVSNAHRNERRIVPSARLHSQSIPSKASRLMLPNERTDAGLLTGEILHHHLTTGLFLHSRQMVRALGVLADIRLQEGLPLTPAIPQQQKPARAQETEESDTSSDSPLDRFDKNMAVRPDALRVA